MYMVNKILICFGTRPEWLKVKPLVETLDNCQLLFTGQHKDLLNDIEVDYHIEIGNQTNRLDQIISDCLIQFPDGDYDTVLVHGDTVSALACALAAFSRKKKIIHLEAGLRSHDLNHPYPEEGYRQMISRIADINLAPTEVSAQNLKEEKVRGVVHTVGNSILDTLLPLKGKAIYGNKVLVTLHRWENHRWIDKWFEEIDKLAEQNRELDFILPLHHHPEIQKHKYLLKHVTVVPSLPHNELLEIMLESKLIITDSGGVQEEGTFFNKKVIVCRSVTERPEGIETGHLYLCHTPEQLRELFGELINNYYIDIKCPYGEGNTSKLIKELI
jgi:UDP-N-acetylglucosamine 2-epimerase (non-hydrolysing)